MISPQLLAILCCPATHQTVMLADAALIQRLNEKISRAELLNAAGKKIDAPLDGGLIRADQKVLYPIRQNLPVMLAEEAISL